MVVNEIRSSGLIKGPSAFALLRLRYRCTTVALAGLGVVLLLSGSGIPQSWFTNVLVLAMMIPTIPVALLIVWVPVKAQAEQEAGYTTLRNELKDLEQRDPYLGRTIRNPGGEYLPRTDFLAIMQVAKEQAERLSRPADATSGKTPTGGTE
ncbi:hypothetical protein [Arthrobacter sp. 92]|uniref:hypothetical protein n=1 Tax=Arthrobacter sp. 92 TaxID=3418175 RepID=UPI003D039490